MFRNNNHHYNDTVFKIKKIINPGRIIGRARAMNSKDGNSEGKLWAYALLSPFNRQDM